MSAPIVPLASRRHTPGTATRPVVRYVHRGRTIHTEREAAMLLLAYLGAAGAVAVAVLALFVLVEVVPGLVLAILTLAGLAYAARAAAKRAQR